MIQGDPLAADGHVLKGVSLAIRHYLVVIGMYDPIKIEKVFYHFGEGLVKCKDVMRLQICLRLKLALLHD